MFVICNLTKRSRIIEFANTLKQVISQSTSKYGLQGWGHSPDKWAGYPTKRGFDYFYGSVRHVDGHQHYPANFGKLVIINLIKEERIWENNKEVSSGLDKCYTTDLWTAKATINYGSNQNQSQDAILHVLGL